MDGFEAVKREDWEIEDWFYEFEKDVTNFLVYYTGRTDVEDLVQETFIKAFMQKDCKQSPKAWLLKIARNTAIDETRRKSLFFKKIIPVFHPGLNETAALAEDLLIKNERNAELYQAIRSLPPKYREAVILKGIADLSSAEAAEALGCSVNKVNVTFHRALKKLRQKLGGDTLG